MKGLGTLINVGAILLGGLLGRLGGRRIKPRLQEALTLCCGMSVIFLSIGGVLSRMLVFRDGAFSTAGELMMILSLAIGTVIGELLDIDGAIERFGAYLKQKTGNAGDGNFVSAFVTASCTVCIGAMAVVGSIEDGISGNFITLASKSLLDLVIVCVMTASMGKGAVFSAIPVGLFQGSITLLAILAGNFMTEPAMHNLSLVGNVLICCVGMNLVFKDLHIRVANMLPSIFIAAAFGFMGIL